MDSDTVTFRFDMSGSVTQTVRILSDDSPEQFFEKLQEGEYWTTLATPHFTVLNLNGDVVGEIEDTEIMSHTEYNEFERVEEEEDV